MFSPPDNNTNALPLGVRFFTNIQNYNFAEGVRYRHSGCSVRVPSLPSRFQMPDAVILYRICFLFVINQVTVYFIFFCSPLLKEIHCHLRKQCISKHIFILLAILFNSFFYLLLFCCQYICRSDRYNFFVADNFLFNLILNRYRRLPIHTLNVRFNLLWYNLIPLV